MAELDDDTHTLHLTPAQIRAQSIHMHLSSASTLCSTAEMKIKFGQRDQAEVLIQRLHHSADTITRHLHEQGYVPDDELNALQDELTSLHVRLIKIEQTLAPPPPRTR